VSAVATFATRLAANACALSYSPRCVARIDAADAWIARRERREHHFARLCFAPALRDTSSRSRRSPQLAPWNRVSATTPQRSNRHPRADPHPGIRMSRRRDIRMPSVPSDRAEARPRLVWICHAWVANPEPRSVRSGRAGTAGEIGRGGPGHRSHPHRRLRRTHRAAGQTRVASAHRRTKRATAAPAASHRCRPGRPSRPHRRRSSGHVGERRAGRAAVPVPPWNSAIDGPPAPPPPPPTTRAATPPAPHHHRRPWSDVFSLSHRHRRDRRPVPSPLRAAATAPPTSASSVEFVTVDRALNE